MSDRPCTMAYVLQRRTHFFGGIAAATVVGLVVGAVVHQWILAVIVVVVLVLVSTPLVDRRVAGLSIDDVVQAKCAPFAARPTKLLDAVPSAQVEVLNSRR